MKYQIGLNVITILGAIYNVLLILDKNYKIDTEKRKKLELKKWESWTTLCVNLILICSILFIMLKNKQISYVYSFIYYLMIFSVYVSMLMNILIKKDDDKITKSELSYLTIIPVMFSLLYNTKISQEVINIIRNICGESIIYFIIVQNIKCFIVIFFIMINFFLILIELKEILHVKKKENNDIEFEDCTYIYENARYKTGIVFFINYIKDILIFIKMKINAIIRGIYVNAIKYIFKVFIKFLRKLTNNFSVYVIIIKTFSISIIISLLVTYYKLLILYKDEIITDFYSVVITAIIIPIILNIIADLKEESKTVL